MATTPSVPLRCAPLHDPLQRKGQPSTPSVPVPSPSHREGTGNGRGWVTKGGRNGYQKGTLPLHSQGALPEEGLWPSVPPSDLADEWMILRCASSATSELAEELREEGLLAWAPMIRVQKRLPRRRKTEMVTKPLLPSFVFVAQDHGEEALDLAARGRVHQCKRFLFNEEGASVPAHQLGPLYQAQVRGTMRKAPLVPGDRVELLTSLYYLAKATVVSNPRGGDSYQIELDGQNLKIFCPGFLLRKILT